MKLVDLLESEDVKMMPLMWLNRDTYKKLVSLDCNVIPIPGYQETKGYRPYKIIGKSEIISSFVDTNVKLLDIYDKFTLTARYASCNEFALDSGNTVGIQMFDHLDDDEKIQALKYYWFDISARYIIEYFRSHPDLLYRAKQKLNIDNVSQKFKDIF